MPVFERGGVTIHYEEYGPADGPLVLATHGFAENTTYWTCCGVAQAIAAAGYRVVLTDMRGHGRTTVAEGEPFTAEAIGDDIEALADHFGAARFHLLSHATGGMAAARYAMRANGRLASVIITDAGSATQPFPTDGEANRTFWNRVSWDAFLAHSRREPGVFLFNLDNLPNRDELWRMIDTMFRLGVPAELGRFAAEFYADPDPRVDLLRRVDCPTLVLLGALDHVFVEPSALMAREIPDCRHVVLPGVGHMTAMEAPERTAEEIVDFLATTATQ